MTDNTSAPQYYLRGLKLIGWRDMQHALDYLYAGGALKEGTLVAINAEKMLTIEDNPHVRSLIEAAEFKYADGISVVRSIRKKFPQARGRGAARIKRPALLRWFRRRRPGLRRRRAG